VYKNEHRNFFVDEAKSILLRLDRDGSYINFIPTSRIAHLCTQALEGTDSRTKIDLADLLTLFEKGWISLYDGSDGEFRYRITEDGRKEIYL
jgi:hypothetical protein